MIPVSIRMRQCEVDEVDKAASQRARKMQSAWSRTDEIRYRLQGTFASRKPVNAKRSARNDALLAELRAIRALLDGGGR